MLFGNNFTLHPLLLDNIYLTEDGKLLTVSLWPGAVIVMGRGIKRMSEVTLNIGKMHMFLGYTCNCFYTQRYWGPDFVLYNGAIVVVVSKCSNFLKILTSDGKIAFTPYVKTNWREVT